MVRKCANPSCVSLFLYYRGGRVLLLNLDQSANDSNDVESTKLEYFWLCEECAPRMTVIPDQTGSAVIKPL